MDIKIDSEAVRGIVAKGILEVVGEEQRALIIEQAVRALLEQPDRGYGRKGNSPLQDAFNNAVREIASDVVADYLAQDAIDAFVRKQMASAMEKLVADQGWEHVIGQAIADRVADKIREDRS